MLLLWLVIKNCNAEVAKRVKCVNKLKSLPICRYFEEKRYLCII